MINRVVEDILLDALTGSGARSDTRERFRELLRSGKVRSLSCYSTYFAF
jgi:hypothetical protein